MSISVQAPNGMPVSCMDGVAGLSDVDKINYERNLTRDCKVHTHSEPDPWAYALGYRLTTSVQNAVQEWDQTSTYPNHGYEYVNE